MGGEPIDTGKTGTPAAAPRPAGDPPTSGRGARTGTTEPVAAVSASLPVKVDTPSASRFALVPYALKTLTLPGFKVPHIPSRHFVTMLEAVLGCCAIVLLLLVVCHIRLLQGPIQVDFLAGTVQEAINREIEPFKVEIGGAVVRYEEGAGDVHFRLLEIALLDENGVVVAVAPSSGITLSVSALLSGRIAPSRIDLIGPALQVYSSAETGLSLSAGVPGQDDGPIIPPVPVEVTAPPLARDSPPAAIARPASISIPQTIATALARARRHESASSYLTGIGLSDARIVLIDGNRRSRFYVPKLNIGFDHRQKKSFITGDGTVAAEGGDWQFKVQAKESEKQRQIALTVDFEDVVPSRLGATLPQFPALGLLGMPVDGSASINISHEGQLLDLSAEIRLDKGPLMLSALKVDPIAVNSGLLSLRYVKEDGRIEFRPSSIETGSSRLTLAGTATPRVDAKGQNVWDYEVAAGDAVIGDASLGLPPKAIDQWVAAGTVTPAEGLVTLGHMHLGMGPARVEMAGQWSNSAGVSLTGTLSSLPVDVFKRLWPVFLETFARDWVAHNVGAGMIEGGRFRFTLTPSEIRAATGGAALPDSAISAEIRARDLDIAYLPDLPPVQTGPAVMRLTAGQFRLEAEQGFVALPSGRRLDLSNAAFTVGSILSQRPDAGVIFDVSGDAEAAMELLDSPRLGYMREAGLSPGSLAGKARGNFEIRFPLITDIPAAEVSVTGKAQITELKTSSALNHASIEGGTVDIAIGDKAVEAKGDVLLNGVAAQLSWVKLLGGDRTQANPVRMTATLDSSDREVLGMSVEHMLRGDVPVTISIAGGAQSASTVDVQADLTNSELVIENMAWRKAPGQPAQLSFRRVTRPDGGSQLQNFRIVGQDIAIEGEVELSAENRLIAFHFPDFSFNVVTHLEVTGKLRPDNVWDVTARGPTYDGRQLFRSLFSAGKLTDKPLPPSKYGSGIDLKADIGTMTGFSDATLSDVKIMLQRREGKMTALDARGTLQSGKPVVATLEQKPDGHRSLVAQSQDAGAAFKLVGFYGNAEGGQASLRVDLDGDGVERNGLLITQNFAILGDPVVTQVLAKGPNSDTKFVTKEQRSRIDFDRMRIPFTVGNGQLVLYDSYINGPALGATMRGKVDFGRQVVQIGGTYVPLYGLNCILSDVLPPLSVILSGRYGECLFGITFAIQGGLQNPQVSVNPVSALAPGVFRQIFDFMPGGAQITAPPPSTPPAPEAQASSMPPMTAAGAGAETGTIPGDVSAPRAASPPVPAAKTSSKPKPKSAADAWAVKTEK